MANSRAHVSSPTSTGSSGGLGRPATWVDWLDGTWAFQVHVARDVLGAWNRQVAALCAVRDMPSLMSANEAAMDDWRSCLYGIHHEWLALATVVPPDALSAAGWRLRPGTSGAAAGEGSNSPDLLEQSRLGFEMLMRPWLPATELDHTDEFVA